MTHCNHEENQHQLVYLFDLVLRVSPYDFLTYSEGKTLNECKNVEKADRSLLLTFFSLKPPSAKPMFVPVSRPFRVAVHDRGASMKNNFSSSQHILIDTVRFVFALAFPGSQPAAAKSGEAN
jgi:hypothetical protein